VSTTYQTKPRNLTYSSSINVSNSINKLRLSDRVYEFYCILSIFAFFFRTTKANYSTITKFYEDKTNKPIHIDTVKSYMEKLIDSDLLAVEHLNNRSGKFYLHLGYNISSIDYKVDGNTYENARTSFVPFYLKSFKTKGLLKGSIGLETYMSSFPENWQHRKGLVIKDLDICTRTYYTKKENLQNCGIVIKTRLDKINYRYQFKLKNQFKAETRIEVMAIREAKEADYELKRQQRSIKKFEGYTRHYFVGELGTIVKEYKITMNNLTKNLDPTLALEYAKLTIKSYGERTNAKLIMDSWKKQYNSSKVFEARHQAYKEEARQENIAIKVENKMNGVSNNGVMGMQDIMNYNQNKQQFTDDTTTDSHISVSRLIGGEISPLITNTAILPTQYHRKPIQAKSDGHRQALSKFELFMETSWEQLYKVLCLNNKVIPDKQLSQELTHALKLVKSKDDFLDIYYNVYLTSDGIESSNNNSLHRQLFTTIFNTFGTVDNLKNNIQEYLDRHRYIE
jgi:hypothetical protein